MSNNYHFRIATKDDAPRLQALIEGAFRFTDASIEWIGSPDLAKTFSIDMTVIVDRIASQENDFLIASETPNGDAIACANVYRKESDYGRIALLTVDPTIQRSGLGKTIMKKAEDYLTEEFAVKRIGLNALDTRKGLIAWYERQGYVKTGEITKVLIDRFGGKEEISLVELEKN
ncbi:hypothetical protein ACLX1H_004174 [Fusarium chlamydosporum]